MKSSISHLLSCTRLRMAYGGNVCMRKLQAKLGEYLALQRLPVAQLVLNRVHWAARG